MQNHAKYHVIVLSKAISHEISMISVIIIAQERRKIYDIFKKTAMSYDIIYNIQKNHNVMTLSCSARKAEHMISYMIS